MTSVSTEECLLQLILSHFTFSFHNIMCNIDMMLPNIQKLTFFHSPQGNSTRLAKLKTVRINGCLFSLSLSFLLTFSDFLFLSFSRYWRKVAAGLALPPPSPLRLITPTERKQHSHLS